MGSDSTGLETNSTQSTTSAEYVSQVEQKSPVSHATVARYKESIDNLTQAQTELVKDIVRSSSSNPNGTMELIQKAKRLQEQVSVFTQELGSKVTGDFTAEDVAVMRDMKDRKITESTIASHFGTNKTKVNRLLNNK